MGQDNRKETNAMEKRTHDHINGVEQRPHDHMGAMGQDTRKEMGVMGQDIRKEMNAMEQRTHDRMGAMGQDIRKEMNAMEKRMCGDLEKAIRAAIVESQFKAIKWIIATAIGIIAATGSMLVGLGAIFGLTLIP